MSDDTTPTLEERFVQLRDEKGVEEAVKILISNGFPLEELVSVLKSQGYSPLPVRFFGRINQISFFTENARQANLKFKNTLQEGTTLRERGESIADYAKRALPIAREYKSVLDEWITIVL